jgi:hypothetical protein
VIIPGFLTGGPEFQTLAESLTRRGIPSVVVPFPNWHWIPCLGGRSVRPILERIDFAVRHVTAANTAVSSLDPLLEKMPPPLPSYSYSLPDLWYDFWNNPGGIQKVGGSDLVDEYPIVEPRGHFPMPTDAPKGKIALIGHSAGGWIARIYLSQRSYGGRIYDGSRYVHSLVTLGTPHKEAPGPAFEGIRWCNREIVPNVQSLAVGGTGFRANDWGALTKSSYAFCSYDGTDGSEYDGDGVTPIESALGMAGADTIAVPNCTHFCWSDVAGSQLVAPELTQDHAHGRHWYGDPDILDQWITWLDRELQK